MIWTKKTVTKAINNLFKEFDMTVIREDSDSEDSDSEGSDSEGSDSEGSDSEGSDSEGSDNEGSYNKGSYNKGSYNKGSYSEGSYNKGSYSETFYFEEDEKFIDETVKASGITQIKFKIFFRDFKPDYIDIEYFKSFHNGKQIISGTRLLNKFKTLGKILNVKYIKLYDGSRKQFNKCIKSFNLSVLEILTGNPAQSWYNSKGFVSDHHTENVEHNETQRNKLFKDVIDEIKAKMKLKKENKDELLNKHVTTLYSLIYSKRISTKRYPDCRELTLYQVFRRLKNKYLLKSFKRELTTEQCESIKFIIIRLERYIIKYKKELKYTISSQEDELTSLKNGEIIPVGKRQLTSQQLTRKYHNKQQSKTQKNTRFQE